MNITCSRMGRDAAACALRGAGVAGEVRANSSRCIVGAPQNAAHVSRSVRSSGRVIFRNTRVRARRVSEQWFFRREEDVKDAKVRGCGVVFGLGFFYIPICLCA